MICEYVYAFVSCQFLDDKVVKCIGSPWKNDSRHTSHRGGHLTFSPFKMSKRAHLMRDLFPLKEI